VHKFVFTALFEVISRDVIINKKKFKFIKYHGKKYRFVYLNLDILNYSESSAEQI
jgi:hypothetical protein